MALLFAVFWGYLFFGVIDLFVFLQGPEFHESFHLETGWGLFFLVLVAAPLVAVAVAPDRVIPAAFQQVLLVAMAIAIGAALSASPRHLLPAVGLGATAVAVAALGGGVRAVLRALVGGRGARAHSSWSRRGRGSPMRWRRPSLHGRAIACR
jgi:hypothetical protein